MTTAKGKQNCYETQLKFGDVNQRESIERVQVWIDMIYSNVDFNFTSHQENWKILLNLIGSNRPKSVIHYCPLYGKQFNGMEFGCGKKRSLRNGKQWSPYTRLCIRLQSSHINIKGNVKTLRVHIDTIFFHYFCLDYVTRLISQMQAYVEWDFVDIRSDALLSRSWCLTERTLVHKTNRIADYLLPKSEWTYFELYEKWQNPKILWYYSQIGGD